ncbi:hypothetical protein [Streptomyces sp. NPDC003032]
MEQRTDRKTLELAREMVKAMAAHIQGGTSRYPTLRELVPYVGAGNKEVPIGPIPILPDERREMAAMGRDAAIHEFWKDGKAVLAMDEYLLANLSESLAELPTAAVRSLEYRNPLIVLTTPDFSDEDSEGGYPHVTTERQFRNSCVEDTDGYLRRTFGVEVPDGETVHVITCTGKILRIYWKEAEK